MAIFTILPTVLLTLILLFLIYKFFNGPWTPIDPGMTLKNKIIIITGCTNGIGKETALAILEKGAKVIFACRDENRTNNLINSIIDLKMRANSFFIKLDLSNISSIDSFVKEFKFRFKNFDILINNAGVNIDKYNKITGTELETTIMTNHIGPFYLTNELLDCSNKKSRVINLSSFGHNLCSEKYINDFLNDKISDKNYSVVSTYSLSKLCNIVHVKYLNDYFFEKNIEMKACAVHPGLVRSKLFSHFEKGYMKFFVKILTPLLFLFSKSTLAGSQTSLHCTYMEYEKLISGGYYSDCKLTSVSKYALSRSINEKIIKKTYNIISNLKK
jgi:NAD(P)-dependent dehydrogenase (short-subunit alcohol dehydrogenase family)